MKCGLVATTIFSALLLGSASAFAVTSGKVFAFGNDSLGRTGLGTTNSVTTSATAIDTSNLGGLAVTQAAGGSAHSLLLAENGSVFAFGWNENGRTGLGTPFGIAPVATPVNLWNLDGRAITQVAAGAQHSLLLTEDGSVFSFGDNSVGQLGLGLTGGSLHIATAIDTLILSDHVVKQVAAGTNFSLLLTEDGTVFAFGSNFVGQTGLGELFGNTTVATPILTTNLGGRAIKQVASGDDFGLLLAEDGTVFSFGNNVGGKTGLGTTQGYTLMATPIDTSNLGGRAIKQVSAGNGHSLLLAEDGAVFAFGGRPEGGTGGGIIQVATPIDLSNLNGRVVKQVAAGGPSFLLTEDGALFSFGGNSNGASGQGTSDGVTMEATPIDMSNLSDRLITQVEAGPEHSLIITALVGDLDGDGFVGINDLNLLLGNWNLEVASGDWLQGDPSADGFVGIDDLNQVLGNWNAGTPPGLTVVPEPGTLVLSCLALSGWVCRRSGIHQ